MRTNMRQAAVAGRFYAGRHDRLAADVDGCLASARAELGVQPTVAGRDLRAVVSPHAGYIYSGLTAAFGYSMIDPALVDRVVVLGPAHFVPVRGIAVSTATAWRTPLGDVPLDYGLLAELDQDCAFISPGDAAHAPEHSIEVQVPFLQRVLEPGWTLVPLLVGHARRGDVAEVIHIVSALPGTLVVISTDLSHYLPYVNAKSVDAGTIGAINALDDESIGDRDACGAYPLRGLVCAARQLGWDPQLLDARNSGDTAGARDQVVGYASFAFWSQSAASVAGGGSAQVSLAGADSGISPDAQSALLALARTTIKDALAPRGVQRAACGPRGWQEVAKAFPETAAPGASFVTLKSASGDLLGCIGSLSARQGLARDVAEHAYDAAFRDTRFPPMTPERASGMVIDISVLGATKPFSVAGYADLVGQIEVGTGIVIEAGFHRATFLPAVWESLNHPADFVAALWRKAGLAPRQWPRGIEVSIYSVQEFAESGEPASDR